MLRKYNDTPYGAMARYDRATLQTFFCSQELRHFLHAFHFLRATLSSHVLPYEKS